MRSFKRLIVITLLILLIIATGFIIWANTPPDPMTEAINAMKSSTEVQVSDEPWIVFEPAGVPASTGLILYPGGRVDPRAYAPIARSIAQQGYKVVIVPMPLNLSVFNPSAAEPVIEAFPEIQHWAIGGHSLGGSMAANFAKNHPGMVQGLLLWASYPASSDDLSNSGLNVVSIFGSQDGLATGVKIEASRPLLPDDTTWISIKGGNHSQFGWYGEQAGDNPPMISRADQQSQMLNATLNLLKSLK
jgi:hypothetical protein